MGDYQHEIPIFPVVGTDYIQGLFAYLSEKIPCRINMVEEVGMMFDGLDGKPSKSSHINKVSGLLFAIMDGTPTALNLSLKRGTCDPMSIQAIEIVSYSGDSFYTNESELIGMVDENVRDYLSENPREMKE